LCKEDKSLPRPLKERRWDLRKITCILRRKKTPFILENLCKYWEKWRRGSETEVLLMLRCIGNIIRGPKEPRSKKKRNGGEAPHNDSSK